VLGSFMTSGMISLFVPYTGLESTFDRHNSISKDSVISGLA
jgi:hypothetical protein